MLRIRLRRVGKKGKPSYRIVVADSTAPRDGAYLEWIGNYDPMADPPVFNLKEDRAARWLSEGAQPSDAVARILDKSGLMERALAFGTATASSSQADATTAVAVATPPPAAEAPVVEAPADEAPSEEPSADEATEEPDSSPDDSEEESEE